MTVAEPTSYSNGSRRSASRGTLDPETVAHAFAYCKVRPNCGHGINIDEFGTLVLHSSQSGFTPAIGGCGE